jgi:phosphoribosylanthranilate isomerase
MALKTFVKVGNISSLSDARYCAGMGVDMLGFQVEKDKIDYVNPQSYTEMISWLVGVQFIAEFSQSSLAEMNEILQEYPIHAMQIEREDVLEELAEKAKELDKLPIGLIFKSEDAGQIEKLATKYNHLVNYFLLANAEDNSLKVLKSLSEKCNLLIEGDLYQEIVVDLLANTQIKGIGLQGSIEEKSGLKDFGNLADILEALEID